MKCLLCLLLSLCTLHAQLADNQQAKEAAIDSIFGEREATLFTQAIARAKSLKVAPQVITEAKFLYAIDSGQQQDIIRQAKAIAAQKDSFDIKQSQIFTSIEEWQSAIEYGLALEAMSKGDDANFKKHITEAFWLAPDRSASFSHHIREFHIRKKLAYVTLPSKTLLTPLSSLQKHGAMKFSDVAAKHKAVILHFWSPWTHQFDASVPLVENLALQCAKHNIRFASIITSEVDSTTLDAAGKLVNEIKSSPDLLWFRDNPTAPLTKTLHIREVPCVVLVSPEGKVLAHHLLSDPFLWQKLKAIAPDLKLPTP